MIGDSFLSVSSSILWFELTGVMENTSPITPKRLTMMQMITQLSIGNESLNEEA